jgi:hypothetical protein
MCCRLVVYAWSAVEAYACMPVRSMAIAGRRKLSRTAPAALHGQLLYFHAGSAPCYYSAQASPLPADKFWEQQELCQVLPYMITGIELAADKSKADGSSSSSGTGTQAFHTMSAAGTYLAAAAAAAAAKPAPDGRLAPRLRPLGLHDWQVRLAWRAGRCPSQAQGLQELCKLSTAAASKPATTAAHHAPMPLTCAVQTTQQQVP